MDRGDLFLTTSIENRESPISIVRCHAKGRGRRVRMSSSGNKETEEHSEVQSTLEDGGLHRGGVVGDLSRGFNRSVIASERFRPMLAQP